MGGASLRLTEAMEEALALAAGRPTAQPTIPDIRATHMSECIISSLRLVQ